MKWLRGSDYPELCETCQAAISQAADILPLAEPWSRWCAPDDPEAPFMFAYDQGWLCGGHECACCRPPEITSALTVQSTTFAPGWTVIDQYWSILPITGNGYDLGQLAVQMAKALDGRAPIIENYRVTAVSDHPDGTWSEIQFEIIFDERPALETLWQVGGCQEIYEY